MKDFIREVHKAFKNIDCIISGKFAGYLMGYDLEFDKLNFVDIYVKEKYKFLKKKQIFDINIRQNIDINYENRKFIEVSGLRVISENDFILDNLSFLQKDIYRLELDNVLSCLETFYKKYHSFDRLKVPVNLELIFQECIKYVEEKWG